MCSEQPSHPVLAGESLPQRIRAARQRFVEGDLGSSESDDARLKQIAKELGIPQRTLSSAAYSGNWFAARNRQTDRWSREFEADFQKALATVVADRTTVFAKMLDDQMALFSLHFPLIAEQLTGRIATMENQELVRYVAELNKLATNLHKLKQEHDRERGERADRAADRGLIADALTQGGGGVLGMLSRVADVLQAADDGAIEVVPDGDTPKDEARKSAFRRLDERRSARKEA